MPKLLFDQAGEKKFETGVKECALFPKDDSGAYPLGVAWNGITNVTKSPTGGEATPFYADGIKYANLLSVERLEGSIEAFTYPEEFEVCDGSAEIGVGAVIGEQPRKPFGVAYKTVVGNDANPELGYKIHLIYDMLAAPTERAHATVNESPELVTFNWSFTTTPVGVTGHKPTASLVLDSTKVDATKMTQLEDIIYGTDLEDARMPLPDEVMSILAAA